jgi:4-hydroxy-3-polyprenylbenzoate decarboxylase
MVFGDKRRVEMSALLINATRHWPYPPVSLPRRDFMERAKAIWGELGLPSLKPRMPWYGYSLGAWTAQDEEEADLALKGEHFVTGEKVKNLRRKPPS